MHYTNINFTSEEMNYEQNGIFRPKSLAYIGKGENLISVRIGSDKEGKIEIILKYTENTYCCELYHRLINVFPENKIPNDSIRISGAYLNKHDFIRLKKNNNLNGKSIVFTNCFFDGNIRINNQLKRTRISFNNVIFNNDISIEQANLQYCNIDFQRSLFYKSNLRVLGCYLEYSSIKTIFCTFYRGVSLENITANHSDIDMSYIQMRESSISISNLNLIKGKISFANASIKSIMIFESKLYDNVELRCKFNPELFILSSRIRGDIFCARNYGSLSFYKTTNEGRIYIGKEEANLKAISSSFKQSYEITQKWFKIHKREKHEDFSYDDLASQYFLLKENYHNQRLFDSEDLAFIYYMRSKQKSYKWSFRNFGRKFLYGTFNLVGCYGTNISSIFITILILWIVFGAVFFLLPSGQFNPALDSDPILKVINSLYYSGITFLTIGYGDIAPAQAGVALKFLSIGEGFLGLFLMSYLTVAVVRKLIR